MPSMPSTLSTLRGAVAMGTKGTNAKRGATTGMTPLAAIVSRDRRRRERGDAGTADTADSSGPSAQKNVPRTWREFAREDCPPGAENATLVASSRRPAHSQQAAFSLEPFRALQGPGNDPAHHNHYQVAGAPALVARLCCFCRPPYNLRIVVSTMGGKPPKPPGLAALELRGVATLENGESDQTMR